MSLPFSQRIRLLSRKWLFTLRWSIIGFKFACKNRKFLVQGS